MFMLEFFACAARQRLARAFKCSPEALGAMALQPGLKAFSQRLQKAAKRGSEIFGGTESDETARALLVRLPHNV
jgi:hypothetical protein